MGKWIRHSSLHPTWFIRFFRPECLSFARTINLRSIVEGPVGSLQSHFLHNSFSKGLDAWIDKHNKYSHFEALETLRSLDTGKVEWPALWSRDPVARRRALKELSFRLPCRPLLRFLYMYVIRRGFLDGREGYVYCRLLALYEFMIVLKVRELRRAAAAAGTGRETVAVSLQEIRPE